MKIKIRYQISSPFIALAAFVFFIYVPYLYPVQFFPFEKVYGFWTHTIICLIIVFLVLISRFLSSIPGGKLKKLESSPVVVPHVNKSWYIISCFFIACSFVMNILIVVNAFMAYDGNLSNSKKSLEEFGGINIISQFCLFFIIPYILYTYKNNKRGNKWFLLILGGILFLRSYFMSERLALLEMVIPVIIAFMTLIGRKISLGKFVKYFLVLLSFFMLLELTRQFKNQYDGENTDMRFKVSWTLERFFDYYGDTQNKFYYVMDNDLSFSTANYLDWGKRIIYRITGGKFDVDTQGTKIDFGEYRWKDFTNMGGLTLLYTDFGIILGGIYLILFFSVFFALWFSLKRGSLYAWCVYPFFFIWIIELARYNAVFLTRFFVPFVMFNIVFLTVAYVRYYQKEKMGGKG